MEHLRAFWERIRQDIHDNPGLWIGIGISALVLVIAYLAYRRNLQNGAVVPANGYGIPNYAGASTDTGGSVGGGYNPTPSGAAGANTFQPFTPTPVTLPTAVPSFSFNSGPLAVGPVAPESRVIGTIRDLGAASAGATPLPSGAALPNINSPLALAQQQHTGVAIDSGLVTTSTLNRTTTNQRAHTGTQTTAYTAPTVGYGVGVRLFPAPPTIPTTIRPLATTAGRVA